MTATNGAVFVYDTKAGAKHQVTSGYFNDGTPTFDPDGKYLFFASDRTFDPVYGDFDNTLDVREPDACSWPRRSGTTSPSPLPPKNDMEGDKKNDEPKNDERKNEDGRRKPRRARKARKPRATTARRATRAKTPSLSP